ncbi:hypothetical protein RJ639_004385 [Escallonia herrerae]|uniref:Glutamate-1-semialdehyde 2,1-aminomutase n=1 Tax=Escallonia herrerae TaxID=1293975 RepID=A0AA88W196_9ASTE|nr:hypothetical protein RJ639_004385 [Escallonia herrerae]
MAGLGLSWPSKLTHRPNITTTSPSHFSSSSGCSSSQCAVKMTVTVEEKKKTFTLKKSNEAFNAPSLGRNNEGGNQLWCSMSFGERAGLDGHLGHSKYRDGQCCGYSRPPRLPWCSQGIYCSNMIIAYNDIADVELLFETNKGEITAVILESVVGNSDFITPKPDFLNALRRITKENGALLIFDKVMTGFRLSYGAAQEYFGIIPDLTTLGKIIGGGIWRKEGDYGDGGTSRTNVPGWNP